MKKCRKILDWIIIVYFAVSLIYNLSGWIVPIKAATPAGLDSAIYLVMGIGGGLLVAVDFFLNDYWRKTRYCWLLYAFLAVMAISTLLNVSFGYMDNVKTIIWSTVQFTLFYSLALRIEKGRAMKYIERLWLILAVVWLVPVLWSLWKFLLLDSYYIQIWGKNIKQGFVENRLWGVFTDPNYGAIVSVIIIIGMMFLFCRTKKRWKKVLCFLYSVLLFVYIVLSGSRTVELVLASGVFLAAYMWTKKRNVDLRGLLVKANRILLAFLSVLLVLAIWEGTKISCSKVPKALDGVAWFHEYPAEAKRNTAKTEKAMDSKLKSTTKSKDVLTRKDTEGDNISNNRIQIWSDYATGLGDKIWFGMSPRNSVKIFVTQNPDSYIAQTDYETHNGYLSVFVCTGIAGSVIMLIFLALQIKRVLKMLFGTGTISVEQLCCILILGSIAMFTFFFTELFFANTFLAALFWLMLGMLEYWSGDTYEVG